MALGAKKDKCHNDLEGALYREKGNWYRMGHRDARNKECHRRQGQLAVMRRWTAMTKEAHRGA